MTDTVRVATEDDADDIARIYSEGIADRVATFETEPRTGDQIRALLRARAGSHPTVVLERGGRVVAWAGASAYRPCACYRGVAEFSFYVERASRGTGAGTAVLRALVEACDRVGLWKLVSRVFPENVASRRACAALGFREVGTYRRHAKLDGGWRDVVIVERLMGEAARE